MMATPRMAMDALRSVGSSHWRCLIHQALIQRYASCCAQLTVPLLQTDQPLSPRVDAASVPVASHVANTGLSMGPSLSPQQAIPVDIWYKIRSSVSVSPLQARPTVCALPLVGLMLCSATLPPTQPHRGSSESLLPSGLSTQILCSWPRTESLLPDRAGCSAGHASGCSRILPPG
jgi:hypothetical protein